MPVVPTIDVTIPSPGGTTSGCEPGDFPQPATTGAVALIQRGTCPFVQKLSNAEAAGAVGVILFNEGDTEDRENALFRSGPPGLGIPAVLSSFAVGKELYDAYKAGENPTVSMTIDAEIEDRFFPQVLAETPGGNPTTSSSPARTSTRSWPARASTTMARAPRRSSRSRSRSRARTSVRARRSGSCGSAARRRAWSARSTTPSI